MTTEPTWPEFTTPGSRAVYWLRPGWDTQPGMLKAVGEWTRANGLDPANVSASGPFIAGRPHDATFGEGPTLTVVMVLDADSYETQPGDEVTAWTDRRTPNDLIRVRRTVPLKVPPPPDLFLNVAAEIQRAAAGDPAMQAWVVQCLREGATL